MTLKDKLKEINETYFTKVYYDLEGKSFDWVLNDEYTIEDLKNSINYLSRYQELEKIRPTKEALREAFKAGQKSISFMKVNNVTEDTEIINKLVDDLTRS